MTANLPTTEIEIVTAEEGGGDYVLLPCLDEPGENIAVFADGSWARWTPRGALSHAWQLAVGFVGVLPAIGFQDFLADLLS